MSLGDAKLRAGSPTSSAARQDSAKGFHSQPRIGSRYVQATVAPMMYAMTALMSLDRSSSRCSQIVIFLSAIAAVSALDACTIGGRDRGGGWRAGQGRARRRG